MAAPIVFFDIAGPDYEALSGFYSNVLGWDFGVDGSVTADVVSPLRGTLRVEGGNENLLYFGVPDVTASLEQVVANGGKISQPRFEVPGVVVLGLFFDPAGNRMGLVEVDENGQAIVP
ncbi:MAG: VOC family protein [Maricaulaceae bacterium]|jgi:predicted enzyme related to lactoylglutathione lyase